MCSCILVNKYAGIEICLKQVERNGNVNNHVSNFDFFDALLWIHTVLISVLYWLCYVDTLFSVYML